MKQKLLKILTETLRTVVGGVFVFSGFVKAIDPIGSAYKIQDYMTAFGLTELFPLALPAAAMMVTAEVVLGLLLLLGLFRVWAILGIALFMVAFTPLTLWVALNNPVADCGCFGDAFTITNWQSFSKNVVLLLSSVFLIFHHRLITPLYSKQMTLYVSAFVVLFSSLFTLYNLHREPVIDFRPFSIGTNIPEGMRVNFETIFIYSKDGVQQEFTEEEFNLYRPWEEGSGWTFVDTKTRSTTPRIENFVIESLIFDEATQRWLFYENITSRILSNPNYSFLMIAYSLDRMRTRQLRHFTAIKRYALQHGYSFYMVTGSPLDVIGEWNGIFLHSDKRVLHTITRTNPGLVLLKEGTIINKWAGSEVAAIGRLTVPLNETRSVIVRNQEKRNAMALLIIALLFLLPMAIFKWIE